MFPNTVKALKNSWPVPKNADINNGNSGQPGGFNVASIAYYIDMHLMLSERASW